MDPDKPGIVYSYGDAFAAPTLPGWENLPDDLITAMGAAHADSAYMYGDEGNGYNPHLMLAYLLQSDAYKRYTRVPTPPNPYLHNSAWRDIYNKASLTHRMRVIMSWRNAVLCDRGQGTQQERDFAWKVLYRLGRILP